MKQALFIGGYGTFLGYSGGAFVVRSERTKNEQVPTASSLHVLLYGEGVSISSAALIACAEKGIPVFVLDSMGRIRATMHSPALYKNYQLQEQQQAFLHIPEATQFVIQLLRAKEERQQLVTHYHFRSWRRTHRTLPASDSLELESKFAYFHVNAHLADIREMLFLKEARSGRAYWRAVQEIVPPALQFHGRIKRHAPDPFNQLLNYGYALLSGAVLRQIIFDGLDPGIGLLHHREGAAYPLVYDFMEPFRPLVDHAALSFVHRQHRALQDRHGELRRSVLRRFRVHFARIMARPEPWSRRKKPLEVLVKDMIAALKTQIGAA